MSQEENSKKVVKKKRPLNREEIRYFLDLYKNYECLWNVNHEDYKNLPARRVAWQEIAHEMDASVDYCKTKVKNLRSLYLAEKKRIDSELQADPNASTESNLFYYNNLSFLDEVLSYRTHDETAELKTTDENGKVKNIKNRRVSMYLPEPVEPEFSKDDEEEEQIKVEDDPYAHATDSSHDENNDWSGPPTKKIKSEKTPKAKAVKTSSKPLENGLSHTGNKSNGFDHSDSTEEIQIHKKKAPEIQNNILVEPQTNDKNLHSPLKKNSTKNESPKKKVKKLKLDNEAVVPQDNLEKVKVKNKKKLKKLQSDSASHSVAVENTLDTSHTFDESGVSISKKEKHRKNFLGHDDQSGDVFLAFGKSIALQLNQLPLQSSTNAMAEIQTLVSQRMLESLTAQSKKSSHY